MDKKKGSEKKGLEKEHLTTNNKQSKTLIEQIRSTIISNWVALAFALAISLITIIVVPIVYSLEKPSNFDNKTIFLWNITGITILNQESILDGSNEDPFGLISSLRFDSNDNLYILDKTKHRILKFDSNEDILILIAGYLNGTNGSDRNSFNSPNDFIIDSNHLIYIADTENHRITSWNQTSKQGTIICGTTGQPGQGTNQLHSPKSLTMDQQSNIYIADYGNNQIVVFNSTTNQLQVLIPYLTNLERNQYVYTPISIKYSSQSNTLVIAQELGFNAIQWQFNTKNWILIAGSASSDLNGTSRTLFNALCNVDIDQHGDTYVVDCNNQRIQFYNGTLTQGRTIAGVIKAVGNNSYIFNQPTAIVLDQQMNLYVADSNNYRIQRFFQI